MHPLETRIPPPLVALATAVLQWFAARLAEPWPLEAGWRIGVAIALALAGLAFSTSGLLAFRRARTTVDPMHPASASRLVTGGIYRWTRNPMYVGLLLVLLAWATFLANLPAFAPVVLYVAYVHRFQIVPEERVLAQLFGEAYETYRRRVRRWL